MPYSRVPGTDLPEGQANLLNNMNKVSNYFRDSYRELLEKVTWPTWEQLQQSTMIVLGATLLITAIVGLMDFIVSGGLRFIYKML